MKKWWAGLAWTGWCVALAGAQATLPTGWSGPWQAATPPTGWTFSNLGTDYGYDFDSSGGRAARFDTSGDAVTIFFAGAPGEISYWIQGNAILAGAYVFKVQESTNGTNWTDAAAYNGSGIPAAAELRTNALQAASRYVRLVYVTKVAGNIGLDGVAITPVKQDQSIAFPAIPGQIATNRVGLAATASSGLPVAFELEYGPAALSAGTNLTFTGAGAVAIVAMQAGDATWNAAPEVTNVFDVAKAGAQVFLADLAQTCDGTARAATATTLPAGLAVAITYDGSAVAPVAAGRYAVTGAVDDALYAGCATGTLTVAMAALTVAPATRSVGSAAGTTTFAVANAGEGTMVYTASESESWLAIASGAAGTNAGTITVAFDANFGAARTGTVAVAAPGAIGSPVNVTVVQAASGGGADNLVLHYTFDTDEGGIVTDASGHGRTATFHGGSWVADGVRGGACRFANNSETLTATDAGLPSGDAPRTLAMWMKLDARYTNTLTTFFSYGTEGFGGHDAELGFDYRDGRNHVFYSPGGNCFLTDRQLPAPGTWIHVTYTYGGNGAHHLYFNGEPSDGMSELAGPVDTLLSGLLLMGGHPGVPGPDGGYLDDVRIYDRVLTAAEIAALAVPGTPSLAVGPAMRMVNAGAGTTTFAVSNAGAGTLEYFASESESWLSIASGANGTNAGTITVAFDANTGADRTGTVVVAAPGATGSPVIVTIEQIHPFSLEINPAGATLPCTAASGLTFEVAADGLWTASSDSPWIAVSGGNFGGGTGAVTYAVATNSGVARAGTITVRGAGGVRTFTVNQEPRAVSLLGEDFESYAAGLWPAAHWFADANAADAANNRVLADPTRGGNQVLRMQGVVGGAWAALGYRAVALPADFWVEGRVWNGTETLPDGTHSLRGGIHLRQGDAWTSYSRPLLTFHKSGQVLGGDGAAIGAYAAGTWQTCKVHYVRSGSTVELSTWLNGQALGTTSIAGVNASGEAALSRLGLEVGAGTALFDDLRVYHTPATYTYYRDADGDGFGDPGNTATGTDLPLGYVCDNTDWNDLNASVHPGAPEVPDGVDNNGNWQIDEGARVAKTCFALSQSIACAGSGWSRVLVLDLTNFRDLAAQDGYRNYTVTYPLYYNVWTGIYLYDYTAGAFAAVIWTINLDLNDSDDGTPGGIWTTII